MRFNKKSSNLETGIIFEKIESIANRHGNIDVGGIYAEAAKLNNAIVVINDERGNNIVWMFDGLMCHLPQDLMFLSLENKLYKLAYMFDSMPYSLKWGDANVELYNMFINMATSNQNVSKLIESLKLESVDPDVKEEAVNKLLENINDLNRLSISSYDEYLVIEY